MKPEKSFAAGMNFYKLFWVFFIGCFLGVIVETIWCFITRGYFESRTGLIYGPFNLVYGFGALIMTVSLSWLGKSRDLWIFIAGTFIGGIYEYLCSLIQEQFFGTTSWDYSQFPLNFNGRVNLLYCFFWGILALLWLKDIYPRMSRLIEKIPNAYGKTITWICVVFMIINMIMSACVVLRTVQRKADVPPSGAFERYIDRHYPNERVERIYPNMQFSEVQDVFEEFIARSEKYNLGI